MTYVVVEMDVERLETLGAVGPFATNEAAMEECRRAYRDWLSDDERCRYDRATLDPNVEQLRERYDGVFVWTKRPSRPAAGNCLHCWEIVELRSPP